MLKVGITGGIGSGKSLIAKIFNELNVSVYDADFFAKQLMETDSNVREKIKSLLGSKSYDSNKINTIFIAQKIYSDNKLLRGINNIVHPAVAVQFDEWCKNQKTNYIIKESAIMFESGADKGLDFIISVSSPIELRKQRTLKREGMTLEKLDAIINNQITDEIRNSKASFVLINDEKRPLLPEIIKWHEFFLTKCN